MTRSPLPSPARIRRTARPLLSGVRWTSVLLLAALGAGTVRTARRLRAVPVLPMTAPADAGVPRAAGWRLLTAGGVEPDVVTFLAACSYADREGLRVLDLLPGDLPTERVLGLLRLVDPAGYRQDRLGEGRGAGFAVLVAEEVLARAGVDLPGPDATPAELMAVVRRVKEYAADATGLAIAPALSCGPPAGAGGPARAAELRAQGLPPGALAAAQLAGLALLAGAAVRQGRWGAAAAGLYWIQPYLALGRSGAPLRPGDLARATAARPVRSFGAAVRTAAATTRRPRPGAAVPANGPAAAPDADRTGIRADEVRAEVVRAEAVRAESLRAEAERAAAVRAEAVRAYRSDLAAGTDRFFEPRREDCPWCGSGNLTVRVRVPDLLQGKPGRFTLEQCGGCGHVFQNPRLSPEGLEFYYRDFYDGRGGEGAATVFGRLGAAYRGRAEMLRPHTDPVSWLDVGTGHGHFCNAARAVWPDTRFDGLDMGDGVRQAERRGWVETGYQGQFPEFGVKLAGQYEVVSMYHYLEHTRDPLAELDTAAAVLAPGGYLTIELPDPESRMARLLGPAWLPWFQPQHQHLIPSSNLREALADRGFTVLAEEHGAAHQGNDFFGAVALTATRLAPDPDRPWGPPATAGRHALTGAVRLASLPCFAAATVLDGLRTALARRTDGGNAYRMLARKDDR
ncbi:class I SAM-dependent methyltransferase [Streptomyces sp. NBC_00347]|uniref:class I SAM-dependent methyltransferase n=1 Tax=Streptomyces sp. NBC_00347 TaxID=2975721 RepID=UPI0022506D1E|nr:class I SAM-dependent methyltransferase [Streptomyces sp. NBC_00347]MCX5128441.1 class I SAM-dependent methyltransferase [Streptomyces sp. NBC_00347]